jgi:Toprim domain
MTAARIAEALAGRKVSARGGNYLVRCPAHDDDSPSLSLRDGDCGIIVHCFAGCSPGDVYTAIRRVNRGLLEPGRTAPEPAKGSSEYEGRQHDKAVWLWGQRRPITGSIAETYLRTARGYVGPLPSTLGFLPERKPEQHPAMIAAFGLVDEPEPGVLGKPSDVSSVHLTLLKRNGTGKADVKPNKLIIGRPIARPVVLAPPNDLLGLAITEGIEDALSAQAATGLGAWAAGSAPFMPALAETVPDYIETVTIYAHADKAGQDGARKLAETLHRRDIEVLIEGLAA